MSEDSQKPNETDAQNNSSSQEQVQDTQQQPQDTQQQSQHNQQGILAASVNFITSFLSKPWQNAFPKVSLCNPRRVAAYVLLLLSFMLPSVSIMGDSASLLPNIEGFFGFIFILSALVAAITFGLGLSLSIPKIASKIVLGIILFVIIKGIWDIISGLIDLMDLCGRNCGSMVEMMFSDFGLGDTIVSSIDIGFYLFIAALVMLFPCAFSSKVAINEPLVSTLKEINAIETDTNEYTNEDIGKMASALKSKGQTLLVAGSNKLKDTDIEAIKRGASNRVNSLTNDAKSGAVLQNPLVKISAALLLLALLIWLVWPNSINAPDRSAAEFAYKKNDEYQSMVAISSLLGPRNAVSMEVKSIDDCDEYEFDDGDLGVVCTIEISVSALGEKENSSERSLFFQHPSRGWEYHGSI